ncbi:hypothetical protein BGZ60DRAFT_527158 [Tricladium varicosporioides]|nr:hypothetical protein BGZ60DRAFT_527158 [Hymenoscyphus varicosporioides]
MSDLLLNFDLQPGGSDVENNNFHTLDAYPGQIERSDVYDYGTELNMQMNLVEIIHGTMNDSPGSLPATLIIADFHFVSRDASRRFRRATIELRFRDLTPEDVDPPEVFAIAPEGVFRMNKTEKTQELKRSAKGDLGAAFVANVTAGVEWSLTETRTKYKFAKLTGVKTKKGRDIEPKNVAMWSMDENEKDENGIPSLLRTAILLRRKRNEQFRCGVLVNAKVDWRTRINLESRTAGGDINPVLFDPDRLRTTPIPPNIDPKNLGSLALNTLMAVQSNTTIETVVVTQSNGTTDGHSSTLTKDLGADSKNPSKSTDQHLSSLSSQASLMRSMEKTADPASASADKQPLEPPLQGVPRTIDRTEELSNSGIGSAPDLKTEDVLHVMKEVANDNLQQSGTASGHILGRPNLDENASLEETMRLLLHAVRKGIEVMAEAVSPHSVFAKPPE